MKRWIILSLLVLLATACADSAPPEAAPLRGWDGELHSETDADGVSTTTSEQPPASVAFSDQPTVDEDGWINPEFVFQVRSGIPGGYGPNRLYVPGSASAAGQCADPADVQELAETEQLIADWTAGLGRDDGSTVKVMAISVGSDGGELGLRMHRDEHRCDAGIEVVMRAVPELGEVETYQRALSDDFPATWSAAFSRNNIVVLLIVQTSDEQFDEALFDRLALSVHDELHQARFQDQIFQADIG